MKKMNMVAVILSCMSLFDRDILNAQTPWDLDGNTVGAPTYIGTNDNYHFPIYTNALQRMIVDSIGNVGIGSLDIFSNPPIFPRNRLVVQTGVNYDWYSGIPDRYINGVGVLSTVSRLKPENEYLFNAAFLGTSDNDSAKNIGGLFQASGNAAVNIGVQTNTNGSNNNIFPPVGPQGADYPDASMNIGVRAVVAGDNSTNIGFQARINDPDEGTSNVNYGVRSEISVTDAITNYGVAIDFVQSSATTNYGNHTDLSGATGDDNYGYYTVLPYSAANNNYGVYADLSSSAATNSYAVYGKARSGSGSGTDPDLVNATNSDYAGYFDGDVFCSNTYLYSDAKLKQNVKEYKSGLEELGKLQIKSYTFNREKFPDLNLPQGRQVGVLSSNMKEVFPNLVKHTVSPCSKCEKKTEFEAVNYTALIPMLVQGVKELNMADKQSAEKAKEQDDKIAELTKQISDLKSLLTDICKNGCEGFGGSNPSPPAIEAVLYQSVPNPTSGSALINYEINIPFISAVISVSTMDGRVWREFQIASQGKGSVQFDNTGKSDNTYKYSLIIDGTVFGTKSLVITRH